MRKVLVIAGIVLIAIGKIFLAGGILSLEGLQKCMTIDPSIIMGPNAAVITPRCTDSSMNYFIVSGVFLAAGVVTLVYGFKSKKTIRADA